ncbi:MAG: sulfur carrier protein ThiS [Acidobacteriota bacterium]
MTVIVNGNQTVITEGSAIGELIKSLDLNPELVAVELNRRIIRRADWDSTTISEGDRVEIVHFVGGGEAM